VNKVWGFVSSVCTWRSEVSRGEVGGTTGEAIGWANGDYVTLREQKGDGIGYGACVDVF
jgi:hypothetical protein